jgi:murein DD-endopeptidase MepM/ murein hydrolase activator NlpD
MGLGKDPRASWFPACAYVGGHMRIAEKKHFLRGSVLLVLMIAVGWALVIPATAAKGKRAKKAGKYKSLDRLQAGLRSVVEARRAATDKLNDLKGEDDASSDDEAALREKIQKCRTDERHIRAEIRVVSSMDRFFAPVPGRITSRYGMRHHPILNVERPHHGIDLAGSVGDPVRAAWTGVVLDAGYIKGYGNAVVIVHPGEKTSLYGHLSQVDVEAGQTVTRGAKVGEIGNSGLSTGPHLHFEVRLNDKPIDPARYW